MTIAVQHLTAGRAEHFGCVADALLRRYIPLPLPRCQLLHVEEPFVDLNARQASLFHGFSLDLPVPLTVEFLEQVVEIVKLDLSLFLAMDGTIDHCSCSAFLILFALGFAGNFQ